MKVRLVSKSFSQYGVYKDRYHGHADGNYKTRVAVVLKFEQLFDFGVIPVQTDFRSRVENWPSTSIEIVDDAEAADAWQLGQEYELTFSK
jgi:regulation of enolase protein 1 (concanavalin A-like superfamily)